MFLSRPNRISNIKREVGIGTRHVDGHTFGKVSFSDVFCLLGDFRSTLDKLFLELCNQGFGALRVHRFEGCLRVVRYGVSNYRNGRKNGEQDNE